MTNATRIAALEASLTRMESLLLHFVEQATPDAPVKTAPARKAATPARKTARKAATRKAPKPSRWNVGMWARYAITPEVGATFTSKSGNVFIVSEVDPSGDFLLATRA